jgi:hypothetical protein
MKKLSIIIAILFIGNSHLSAQDKTSSNHLYMDVHYFEPGKVKFEDVESAHKKDLATQKKYGVSFMRYWVDEKNGLVYCLSTAPDSDAVKKTHAEAHGLMPGIVYDVTAGQESKGIKPENLFLDIHYPGPDKVTAKDVSEAHKKDLAAQEKYGVRFINYWVDEKKGVIVCVSQASDPQSIIQTHAQAHGLIPASIASVKEGR